MREPGMRPRALVWNVIAAILVWAVILGLVALVLTVFR